MLPIYQAIAVEEPNILGGTTLPSIMTVVDQFENIIGQYVVKVFSEKHIAQTLATNKEVYVNILAQQFDLNVPSPALIQVSEEIIYQLKQKGPQKLNQLNQASILDVNILIILLTFHKLCLLIYFQHERWKQYNLL